MKKAVRADMYERGSVVAWKEPMYEERIKPKRSGRKKVRKKKKTMRHKILRGICFYFLLAGIVATCWVICSFFFAIKEKVYAKEAQGDTSEIEVEGDDLSEAGEDGAGRTALEITPEIRQECQDLYARQGEFLVLVNKERELSASYSLRLRNICKGRLEAADVLYDDLCALLEAGKAAGYEYWIASAYRDRAYQQKLVDEDVQKYMEKGYSYEAAVQKTYEYTMPAGFSEHETGLSLDILCSTNTIMDESQKWEPGNQWLTEHCYEFGFILRYPEEKEDITGIGYEPWHFRYVGKEAAAYLTKKGWTLEEFYGAMGI